MSALKSVWGHKECGGAQTSGCLGSQEEQTSSSLGTEQHTHCCNIRHIASMQLLAAATA